MFRAFDLSVMAEKASELLNDPHYRLLSLKITCLAETGYTVAAMRFAPCAKREIKSQRFLERYVLIGGGNSTIDAKLADKNIRLIKQHVFPSAEGTVVVLDYTVRKGRQVGV